MFHLKMLSFEISLSLFLQWAGYLEVFHYSYPYEFIDCVSNSCLKARTGLTLMVSGTDSLERQLKIGLLVLGLPEEVLHHNTCNARFLLYVSSIAWQKQS